MFTAVWYRYPHGIEGEEMECKSRDFNSFEKAKAFLQGRAKVIKGINWAGGHVEDSNLNWVYELTDDYSEY